MRRAGHVSDVVVLGLCLSNMVSLEVQPGIDASVVRHMIENIKTDTYITDNYRG